MAQRGSRDFVLLLLIAAAAAVGFAWLLRRAAVEPPIGGLEPGHAAPAITAQGWLNGGPPALEDLQGQVALVHAWQTDCLPCWREAPHLVELYERFRPAGVVFIGLTVEGPEMLSGIHEYVERNRIAWPMGYGAIDTLVALDARATPTAWVIGRDGHILWNSSSDGTLAGALEAALAQ
jgi:thiol-disulfide isomerase/thioredoxin